ncbi:MAG: hypothetical protein HZY73_09920 [Micropruina sp.]|nr:MAG: hypothetical protein HZY73_09920 [Micropruina sp.]
MPFLRLAALRTEVGGQRPTLRSVRLQSPAGGVVEVAAVVQLGTRVGALALRLLEAPDGFACVALQASLRLSCRPGAHGRP